MSIALRTPTCYRSWTCLPTVQGTRDSDDEIRNGGLAMRSELLIPQVTGHVGDGCHAMGNEKWNRNRRSRVQSRLRQGGEEPRGVRGG